MSDPKKLDAHGVSPKRAARIWRSEQPGVQEAPEVGKELQLSDSKWRQVGVPLGWDHGSRTVGVFVLVGWAVPGPKTTATPEFPRPSVACLLSSSCLWRFRTKQNGET